MICLTQFPIFCVVEQTTQQQPVRPKQPSAAPPPATATADPAPLELQGPVLAAPPAQASKPAAAAKNKGGDPDRKELFKMTVNADDKRLSRQDETVRRGKSKKEKRLARARWGDRLLEHLNNHAQGTQDPEDKALATNLGERLKSVPSDDSMAENVNEEEEEDWEF